VWEDLTGGVIAVVASWGCLGNVAEWTLIRGSRLATRGPAQRQREQGSPSLVHQSRGRQFSRIECSRSAV
jgi:hypothetical protein